MPDVVLVASARQDHAVRELATTLGYELERQGVPSRVQLGGFAPPRFDRVQILMNPIDYVDLEGTSALPSAAILRRTIFICAQRPPAGGQDDPGIGLLRRAGAVFALDRRDVMVMHRAGIPARLLRPGYSASLDRYDASAPRPIDIMVLGTHTPRRADILRRAAPVLARHNCQIQLSDPGPHPVATSSYLADGRWPLLARTKVFLNLHADEDQRLEWTRVLDAIHAGAVVVSEHATGIAPLDAGAHLLLASPGAIAYVADQLLGHPERLAAIRASAYERLSGWIPYALPVSILRAAIVELVGEPGGDGEDTSAGAAAPAAAGVTPVASDVTGGPAPLQPEVGATGAAAVRDRAISHFTTVQLADSPAWGARSAPRVSVICSLGENGAEAARMLDSVVSGRMRDLEIVIVHGDGAEGAATIDDWMAAHPRVPARRIVLAGRPEPHESLTAAAAVARGDYTLMIEPTSTVYPRALEVLADALDAASDSDLVYPIQELVRGGEGASADCDHLTNVLGWDPARGRESSPLAPLLIRTIVLRQCLAGGDAAVLPRLAAQGGRGQLVPQILGRRPAPGPARVALSSG